MNFTFKYEAYERKDIRNKGEEIEYIGNRNDDCIDIIDDIIEGRLT